MNKFENLPENVRKGLIEEVQKLDVSIYWDYRDELSKEQINQLIDNPDTGLFDLESEIFERNIDYISDLENEAIHGVLEQFEDEIEGFNYDDIFDSLREYFPGVDYSINDLLRKTPAVNVRIKLHSNYDCINSHFFETSGPLQYEQSYLGAVIDAMQFNPQEVKKYLIEKGYQVRGQWPNIKKRAPLVDLAKFWCEYQNTACGANLLTIVGQIDLQDYLKAPHDGSGLIGKITIPAGNYVGFYSSFQGGGSQFDCELLQDFTIDLTKTGATKHDHWGLVSDDNDGYSIDKCYGVTSQFWGNEIKLTA